jgi:hypothetical protein
MISRVFAAVFFFHPGVLSGLKAAREPEIAIDKVPFARAFIAPAKLRTSGTGSSGAEAIRSVSGFHAYQRNLDAA